MTTASGEKVLLHSKLKSSKWPITDAIIEAIRPHAQ
jgi:hypothetical protein